MSSRPITILVTGFSAFPGARINPTEWLVKDLKSRPTRLPPGAKLATAVLDVTYRAIETDLTNLLERHAPDLVLLFGYARCAKGFCVETRAENFARIGTADASGHLPVFYRLLDADQQHYTAQAPVFRMAAGLRQNGLPVELSRDAGGYICNAAFHQALLWQRSIKPSVVSFIHVPQCADLPGGAGSPLSRLTLRLGADTLIRLGSAEARRARQR